MPCEASGPAAMRIAVEQSARRAAAWRCASDPRSDPATARDHAVHAPARALAAAVNSADHAPRQEQRHQHEQRAERVQPQLGQRSR